MSSATKKTSKIIKKCFPFSCHFITIFSAHKDLHFNPLTSSFSSALFHYLYLYRFHLADTFLFFSIREYPHELDCPKNPSTYFLYPLAPFSSPSLISLSVSISFTLLAPPSASLSPSNVAPIHKVNSPSPLTFHLAAFTPHRCLSQRSITLPVLFARFPLDHRTGGSGGGAISPTEE